MTRYTKYSEKREKNIQTCNTYKHVHTCTTCSLLLVPFTKATPRDRIEHGGTPALMESISLGMDTATGAAGTPDTNESRKGGVPGAMRPGTDPGAGDTGTRVSREGRKGRWWMFDG